MNQSDLISVIVPVYNVEQYLPRCIDSLLAQTYRNLEVILVNDGSKDNSGSICDEYAGKDTRIRVIHKENAGLSSARNAGIDVASGEYLTFVDSDDWIEPDAYEHMLGLAREYDVKLVCAGRYDVDEETGTRQQGLCPPRQEVVSAVEIVRRIFVWENMDSGACDKLYHHSLFRQIRFPLGKIVEDVPIMYLIVLDAGRVAMYDRPIYNYFHRQGSITTARVSEKTFHFSEHTSVIYPFIREHYPQIEPEARYFRVRSLVYSVISVELADAQTQNKFKVQHDQCRKALRRHILFILTSRLFGTKERIIDAALALGIYRLGRRIYHAVK